MSAVFLLLTKQGDYVLGSNHFETNIQSGNKMASKFSNGKWVTSKGDPSDMPPVFSELSPSKAAASSGVYMCPQCDYVTDREMKLSEHMKSTLLHISLVTPEVTVSPPLSTVATSSTSPTSTSGGSG